MKNRLQFNRIPTVFKGGLKLVNGEQVWKSGREQATEALENYIKRGSFIPLIGEPIVVRYEDDITGERQLMLAIGKSTGASIDMVSQRDYHIIDTAEINENVSAATLSAVTALDLASAATKDVADYLVILQNMIMSGVGLTDGTYFDNNGRWDRDPSQVGLYDPIENANYIADATSFRDADNKLDKALKNTDDNLAELSGATEDLSGTTKGYLERIIAAAGLNDQEPGEYPGHDETHFIKDATSLDNADVLLDAAIWNLSADTYNTIAELSAGTIQLSADTVAAINELSAGTIQLSADTDATINELSAGTVSGLEYLSGISENIIEAAGLESDGTYEHKHDANFIDDANSLFEADVILDTTLAELSANTVAEFEETNNNVSELSAATVEIQTKEEKIIEAAGLEADGSYPHTHNANFIDEATSLNNADVILDATLAELSANTMAADQVLQEQITEIGNRKILGESAITVNVAENGDSTILLKLANNEKVLTQDISGLKTNISLVYIKEDKKIYLVGKDDEQENPIVISEIDASDFIKDGMLDHVNVFVATEEDHREYPQLVVGETYLALYFNTDAVSGGTVSPAFISVKDLVDVYTVSATSLNDLTIEGYEIRANVDVEHGLAGYDGVMNMSGITDNIINAAGLNLGGQGTYPGHDETHIIKDATSLDNADVLLDAAIWGVSGNVLEVSGAAVYNETIINNILEGTGLNTQDPGEYHGHDETHYIKDATSLDDADVKLDEALWALSGVVADLGDVSELEEKIDRLSAVTKEFSATTDTLIRELSARTIDLQEVYDYIDSADTRLNERIDEVEEVTAAALNELNERVGYVETHMTGEYIPLTGYELSSGLTEDELLVTDEDTVDEAFGKIQKQILDDEEATAAALNDLNDRVNANAQAIAENTGVTALSAAVMSFSSATVNEFSEVHNDITNIENDITNINTNIENVSSFTQFLSAHTLGMLTVNLNGVEQGKYCPSASTTLELEAIQEVTGADVLLTGYELATGTTEEELAVVATDTVNDAFGKVQKQIYDNEAVTAGALNDLDDRVLELSGVVIDDELVVAAALNDLNTRVAEVSGNVEELATNAITGVSVDGVAQPVVDNVANIQISIPTVNSFFDGVEYDSNAKRINFYNGGKTTGTVIDYVDATDFIKDGMVDDVVIDTPTGGTHAGVECLIITFNTDAGKEAIEIPVADIFDPSTLNELSASVINNQTKILTVSGDVIELSAATVTISGNVSNLSAATIVLSGNISELSAATVVISGNVSDLSGSVINNREDIDSLSASIIDYEYVIAQAFNDLNRRVVAISGNSGGGSSVQSDWDEADPNSGAFIKNKPTNVSDFNNDAGYLTAYTAPGTLTTTATTAQATASNEALSGNIALHKVAKTGSYNDLNDKPYIPSIQKVTTAQYEAMEQAGTLDPDTFYFLVD